MRFGAVIVLEDKDEIRRTLEEARRRKHDGENYPFCSEGHLPNERIDELIRDLQLALEDTGIESVELKFLE